LAGCIGKPQSLSPLEQETVDQPLAPSKVSASLQAVFDDKFQCLRWLPVAKMTKKIRGSNIFLPMGVLRIDANQRYNTKMSDTQTSDMIKFAVTFSKEYTITLNTFNVLKALDKIVNQYDVDCSDNGKDYTKRKFFEKI
jgi:hypothetical protein